jgi:uncharacterized Zn finger protein (UPF0148 family)
MNLNQLGGGGLFPSPQNIGELDDDSVYVECPECGHEFDIDDEISELQSELEQTREEREEAQSAANKWESIADSLQDKIIRYKNQIPNVRLQPLGNCEVKPFSGVNKMTCSPIYTVAIVAVKTTAIEGISERIINTVTGILAPDATTAAFMAGMDTDEAEAKLQPNEKIVIRTQAM